jgi:hypothetical protein
MTEHENNLRDLAAMFALTGLIIRDRPGENLPESAYEIADAMMDARKSSEEGIVTIKKKRNAKSD